MAGIVHILTRFRWFLAAGIFIAVDLALLSAFATLAEHHSLNVASPHATAYADTISDSGDLNVVTAGMSQFTGRAGATAAGFNQRLLTGVVTAGKDVNEGLVSSGRFAGMVTGATLRGIGAGLSFTGHLTLNAMLFPWHLTRTIFGFTMHVTRVSSVIQPDDHTPTPVITQLRIKQAAIIESGTMDVAVSAQANTGGACDNGNGNGGYPASWCNANMDTIATIAYSDDTINRECTSYAYWYFTSVEHHPDLKVWKDAKYWAQTSNYPVHSSPAVGSIAVETTGAFGHVAIVQALPGQTYNGQPVPAGFLLVSEMNYDWHGHFRYSYSPVSKFSTYIYP